MIDRDEFIRKMREKWTEYGNAYSTPLGTTWLQIVDTLNRQAGADSSPIWPVIPAELGIGKTTCAKLWCAMLPAGRSALVVVRTRDQAREFADDVNAWSGTPKAVALFSPDAALPCELWKTPERSREFPVVVVCHKSYEMGLDEFSLEAAHVRFDMVHRYCAGRRDIVIIDEALDQVAEARVNRAALLELMKLVYKLRTHPRHALRNIHQHHLRAMRVLESIGRAVREAPDSDLRALSASTLLALTDCTVAQATDALGVLCDEFRRSPALKAEPRAFAVGALDALRRQLNTAPWTNEDAVSSARLLKTPEGTAGVILDATGSINNVYRARKDEFIVLDTEQIRDYSAVTIHEAIDRDTGKVRTKKIAPALAQRMVGQLRDHYGRQAAERRVLVVVSADADTLKAFDEAFAAGGFAEYAVTNWGAVDGKNIWKHFDTLLIGTLHYGSNTQDVNAYLAIAGLEPDDEALGAEDEVKAIRERRIATTIAQAIGRLRLRTMAASDGRCLPCDVFVRLPNTQQQIDREHVMRAVADTLPRVVRTVWAKASRRSPREGKAPAIRENVAVNLVAYVANMAPGSQKVADIRRAIGAASHGTWFRTIARPEVKAALAALGAKIEGAIGRRAARLVKA
jgi:hypothetical protein